MTDTASTDPQLPQPQVVLGSCRLHRVIDADTYEVEVVRRIRVRAKDCWGPETYETKHSSEKELGLAAKAVLESIVARDSRCRVVIHPDGDEDLGDGLSFGRVVGDVYLESGATLGRSLGEVMNELGLTYRTKAELEAFLDQRDKAESDAE